MKKSMISLFTDHPDMYVVDRLNFNKLMNQGALLKLNELEGSLDPSFAADKMVWGKSEEDLEEYLYGIDISDSPIFNNVQITGTVKIAVIRIDAANQENAFKLMKWLIELSQAQNEGFGTINKIPSIRIRLPAIELGCSRKTSFHAG